MLYFPGKPDIITRIGVAHSNELERVYTYIPESNLIRPRLIQNLLR